MAQAQDAAAGEKVFSQCRACHQIGPTAKNGGWTGPERPDRPEAAGTYPGYNYSNANKSSGLTWDEATFREYIRDTARPRFRAPR